MNQKRRVNEDIMKGSWHDTFKDSPYIYIGNLPREMKAQDILVMFSQYGEILDLRLTMHKPTDNKYGSSDINASDTGNLQQSRPQSQNQLSKGYAFLKYEDPRSAILAVDNFDGVSVSGRKIRVDHVREEKFPEQFEIVDGLKVKKQSHIERDNYMKAQEAIDVIRKSKQSTVDKPLLQQDEDDPVNTFNSRQVSSVDGYEFV